MPAIRSTYSLRYCAALFRDAVDAAEEVDVLFHGQVVVERKFLRHVADVLLDGFRLRGDVQPADRRAARSGLQQAAQHANGGGFARAVRAQESEDFAAADVEIDMIHGDEIAEALHQVVDFDGIRLHALSAFRIRPMNTSSSDGTICRNVVAALPCAASAALQSFWR